MYTCTCVLVCVYRLSTMRHEYAYVYIHIYRCIHISISYCPLLAAYLLMHSQDPATFQKPQPATFQKPKQKPLLIYIYIYVWRNLFCVVMCHNSEGPPRNVCPLGG